ncbi:hypothetical protein BOTCAL_0091g00080 [Botryotinia calthae]|uniref:Uncharacterized protein n=1 Tax=Botryotinia calthae TaxID=38488 RepID=A0A4Y8D9C4_9HELO|nr:hypothetical protein BOTCAL_0091g00080 [Botryotinia calthae]
MPVVKVWNAWEILGIEVGKCRWELNTSEKAADGCKRIFFANGARFIILNSMGLEPPSEAFAHLKKLAEESLCEFYVKDSARHRQLIVAWKLKLNEAMCSYLSFCLVQQKVLTRDLNLIRKAKQSLDVEVDKLNETIAQLKVKEKTNECDASHSQQAITIKTLQEQHSSLFREKELLLLEKKSLEGQIETQHQDLKTSRAKEFELEGYKAEVLVLRSKLKEWVEFSSTMKKDFDNHRPFTPPLRPSPHLHNENKHSGSRIPKFDSADQQPPFPNTPKVPPTTSPTPQICLSECDSQETASGSSNTPGTSSATGSASVAKTETRTHSTSSTTTTPRKEGLFGGSAATSPDQMPNTHGIFGTRISSYSKLRTSKSHSSLSEIPAPATSTATPSFKGSSFDFSPSLTTAPGTPCFSFRNKLHAPSPSPSRYTQGHRATSSSSAIPAFKSPPNLFGASPPVSSSTKPSQPPKTQSSSPDGVFKATFGSPRPKTPPPVNGFSFGPGNSYSDNNIVSNPEKINPFARPEVMVQNHGDAESSSDECSVSGIKTPSVSSTATVTETVFFMGGSPTPSGATTPFSIKGIFGSIPPKSSIDLSSTSGEIFGRFSSSGKSFGSDRERS